LIVFWTYDGMHSQKILMPSMSVCQAKAQELRSTRPSVGHTWVFCVSALNN
jgi:hypothetical protein